MPTQRRARSPSRRSSASPAKRVGTSAAPKSSDALASDVALRNPLRFAISAIDVLVDAEPPAWKTIVSRNDTWWFRLSCWTYSLLGVHVLLVLQSLKAHSFRYFPWTFIGLQLVLQGFLSFQADVTTFGRKSGWKLADCAGASTLSLIAVAIPVLQLAGLSTFPPRMAMLLTAATAAGLYCKYRGTQCLRAGRQSPAVVELCHHFLRWHTAWHLIIPIGVSVAMSQL